MAMISIKSQDQGSIDIYMLLGARHIKNGYTKKLNTNKRITQNESNQTKRHMGILHKRRADDAPRIGVNQMTITACNFALFGVALALGLFLIWCESKFK